MCFAFGKKDKFAKEIGAPEKTADPGEIGGARKAEDKRLFGGEPQLRVDRSATEGGTTVGGTGLRMM